MFASFHGVLNDFEGVLRILWLHLYLSKLFSTINNVVNISVFRNYVTK